MSAIADNPWLEISEPLVAPAQERKASYEKWVAEYDSLGWWGRFKMRQGLHVGAMRQLASASVESHMEYLRHLDVRRIDPHDGWLVGG